MRKAKEATFCTAKKSSTSCLVVEKLRAEVMCFFYIFSDVAGDGMTIELSKLEPPETRGYILTTGQMLGFDRFSGQPAQICTGLVCLELFSWLQGWCALGRQP